MSTSLQSFFDEMKKEESNESVDIDIAELLDYCIESKHRELNELGRFIDRIETSITNLRSNADIASFEAEITETLEYVGAIELSKLFIPSFESGNVAVYATEAEEKAAAAKKPLTEKMMDGIRYLIKKIKQFAEWIKKQFTERWKKKGETVQEHLDKQAAKAEEFKEDKAEGKVVESGDKMTLIVPSAFTVNGKLSLKGTLYEQNKKFKDVVSYLNNSLNVRHGVLMNLPSGIKPLVREAEEEIKGIIKIDHKDVVHIEYSAGLMNELKTELKNEIDSYIGLKDRLVKGVLDFVKVIETDLDTSGYHKSMVEHTREQLVSIQKGANKITKALDSHVDNLTSSMMQIRVSTSANESKD